MVRREGDLPIHSSFRLILLANRQNLTLNNTYLLVIVLSWVVRKVYSHKAIKYHTLAPSPV
jgi:hypothetical protein